MDVTGATWRKASRSGGNGGNCVEVAALTGHMAVRDSKDRSGPVLGFSERDWAAFVEGVKAGRDGR